MYTEYHEAAIVFGRGCKNESLSIVQLWVGCVHSRTNFPNTRFVMSPCACFLHYKCWAILLIHIKLTMLALAFIFDAVWSSLTLVTFLKNLHISPSRTRVCKQAVSTALAFTAYTSNLKMEAVLSWDTLINFYMKTRRHSSEAFVNTARVNLKSGDHSFCSWLINWFLSILLLI
jgi:hypothetical protein